ncbi:TonB-dependent receptor [Bacteroides sp. 51]|uniref:SusC/RagA family TonB-linked outer membrane protein n=1 Tax=Bacteroides sp. 51 TaxID=2302938 RepID=UPI0013D6A295|nr:TonB-dependent receptor [Bacteroides sp. 51]NDV82143.1 TonB-dependent receptor [Bacteroides sp. 51]
MKKNSKIILLVLFLLTSLGAYAQSVTVTGKVVDSDGYEVIGANVVVKGSQGVGTITDIDGNYRLQVADASKAILVFTYIGMDTQEVPVNGRSKIDVTLKSNGIMLDEVVAVGYGTTRRKDLTGSVGSVKSDELIKIPTSDITQALAGRIAGVQIIQNEGAPGASISVRVRGGISITQSNEPLYIIDGFPTEDGMSNLDPAEIETIDILKDASSTAIYGARGANGVVVITTKSGGTSSDKKMTVTFDSYYGFKKIANKLDVLSTEEFAYLDYERSIGGTTDTALTEAITGFEKRYGRFTDLHANYGNRPGIDWQDETLGRSATTQNYRVGVSGGAKDLNYNLGYSYYDEQGAMVYSGTRKHNIVLSLNHSSKYVDLNARVSYDQKKVRGMGTSGDGDRFNKLQHILQYRPTIGINGNDSDLLGDEDPLLADESGNVMQNPLLSAAEELKDREWRTFQANAGMTLKIFKGFSFRNNTGMSYQTRRNDIFYGDQSVTGKRTSINGSIENLEYGTFQTSNTLNYNWTKNKHNLTVMAGQEYVTRWTRNFKAVASNFPNDEIGLNDLSLGVAGTPSSAVNYDDNLLSFFGRANYIFADKYIISASFRADGSSKFGKNNKWGYFPSVSAAWRLGEEEFIKNLNLFSDLKLRIGYGAAGNNRIGSYNSLAILESVTSGHGDNNQTGYASKQIPNPDLKWESNRTFNLGVDIGLFNQRLTISPEFYLNRSNNLLLNAKIPYSSGYTSMIINAGETQNTGIDLTIGSTNIVTRDFKWNTMLTFSHNKNTVKALTGESVQLWEASFGYNQNTHIVAVDQTLGQFYGYVTDGIYQLSDFDYDAATQTYTLKDKIPYHGNKQNIRPGMWKFKDTDGSVDENGERDYKVTEDDKTVIGKANPKFYGGLNNTFSYKNFDLSVFLTFSYGNDVLNATKLTNTKAGKKNRNILDVANSSNRWVTIDAQGVEAKDPTALAALNPNKSLAAYYDMEEGDTYIHSWAVEDGSFIKLSNITLGYTFPKKMVQKIGLSNLRLYATGNNLATWTKYTGYDPEVSTNGNGLTPGVDFGAYPRSRSYVFGVNVAF